MDLSKDKENELKRVYKCFYESPKTMKEVDKAIGIMRESICRYCATLEKQGRLYRIRQRRCTATGHNVVWEFTSNPGLRPLDRQKKLF